MIEQPKPDRRDLKLVVATVVICTIATAFVVTSYVVTSRAWNAATYFAAVEELYRYKPLLESLNAEVVKAQQAQAAQAAEKAAEKGSPKDAKK